MVEFFLLKYMPSLYGKSLWCSFLAKKQNKKDFFPYFNTLHNEKNAYFHCSISKKNKIFNIILIVMTYQSMTL